MYMEMYCMASFAEGVLGESLDLGGEMKLGGDKNLGESPEF